jgi:hypothetical protein
MNKGAVRVARFAVALAVFGFFANIVAAQSPKEHLVFQSASFIELQIPMGDGGTTLNLRSKVQPGTIESVVTIVDASGSESGGGKIVHTHLDAATAGEDSTGQKGDAKP